MSLFVWLIFGVALGYIGHLVLSADPDRGTFMNVLLGTIGALCASRLMVSHLGVSAPLGVISSATGLVCLVSFVVVIVLVGLANLLRRGRLRYRR